MSNEERTVIFQLPTVVSGSLACMEGTVTGRTWRLSAGTFVIGRSGECDLHLPSEPGVSKVHAKILAEGDHYVLEDNESRNGTIVNGHVVRRVMLADGDEIQICGCRLRFTQTGGEGRKGAVVPEGAPPSAPPSSPPVAVAPAAAPPAGVTGQEPPTDLVPRVVGPGDVTPPPQKSGGGLFMPFLLGLFFVLVIGGGAAAMLLFVVGEDGPEVALGQPGGGQPTTGQPVTGQPATGQPATGQPKSGQPESGQPEGSSPAANAPEAPTPESAVPPADATPPAPEVAEPPPASPDAAAPTAVVSVPVVAAEAPKTAIRTRGGGRVRAVEATNGATLTRGQTLLRLDDVALAREIATITESVSALAAIAETSEGAKAALADEKAKLRALQSQARQQRVTSPANGTLAGFTVRAGDRVRPRQVIGFIRGQSSSVVAKVPADQAGKWTKGASVILELRAGASATGTVSGTGKPSGGDILIPLSVGKTNTDVIEKARLQTP